MRIYETLKEKKQFFAFPFVNNSLDDVSRAAQKPARRFHLLFALSIIMLPEMSVLLTRIKNQNNHR